MPISWFRPPLKKRTARPGPAAPRRAKLTAELLEDRALLAVAVWDGEGGTLPTPNYNWSLGLNWVGNVAPQPGDDIVFPVLAAGAQKPAPTIQTVNNIPTLVWPPNVVVDGIYLINNLSILDDGYRIDSQTPSATSGTIPTRQLTIQGEIFSNIPDTLGALTGLSLLGPLAANQTPNGTYTASALSQSSLILRLTSTGQSLNAATGSPGVLEISAPITQAVGATVGLQKVGGGRMALSGASSFGGTVTVFDGQLDVSGAGALGLSGTAANGTLVQSGATLGIGGGTLSDSLQVTGNGRGGVGALFRIDRPLVTYAGINPPIGQVLPADTTNGPPAAIQTSLSAGAANWSGGVAMTPSAAVGVTGGLALTISGQITGAGDLTKVGAGSLTLTNANNYTGQTLINVGSVLITNNNALSAGSSTTVATRATLALVGGLVVPRRCSSAGRAGHDLNTNPLGALRLQSGASTYNGTVTLLADTAIGAANGTTLTINGLFDDQTRSNLRKVDQGTLVFPNANPGYNGDVAVENGVLRVTNPLALGAATAAGGGSVTVTSLQAPLGTVSGTLQIQGTAANPTFTFSKALTLNGTGFNSSGALRILDAVAGTTGSNVTLDAGVLLGSATSLEIAALSALR
jgi:autotransporter-associated beta strand protein